MKILFDLRSTGLGNNGGSHTIIRSTNTLAGLGHEVILIDSIKNHYSWTPLKTRHLVIHDKNEVPSADIVVATGFKSVGRTLNLPKRCGIKCHWIRAIETWQMSEQKIMDKVLGVPTFKIVNSICLKNYLSKRGFSSEVIRPGYDFGEIYPLNIRDYNKVILGALYREGVHGRRKRTQWVFNVAKQIKKKYPKVEFWLFGSEHRPIHPAVDKYFRSPSVEEKNRFYNNVSIWLAPTQSEGLHLPPAEAMMTGCPVVATDAELSGTQDYVEHKVTGLVSDDNLDSFTGCVRRLVVDKELRRSLGKNTREKIGSLGNRKTNMIRMVNLFERLTSKRGK